MPEADYVDELLRRTSVSGSGGSMDAEMMQDEIGALVEVGTLDEVGAAAVTQLLKKASAAKNPFSRSERSTQRRAPLGMVEDGTGRNFFSLAATVGAVTTMKGKVSRVAHINRLLIVPSLAGVVIASIKVGDEEQLLAPGVPVELYGTSALTDTEPDNFSPLGPALDLAITLQNTVATAITGTIGCKALCKR
jgi:hypothetical protein